MAENEKKNAIEAKDAKTPKETKKTEKGPSVWKKLGVWFKSLKSECKKISWASWKCVRSNSVIVIAAVIIISIAVGILDYCFSSAIVGLSRLI